MPRNKSPKRDLCSQLVSIECESGGNSQPLCGNLEEIGRSSAVILTEERIPAGSKLRIRCKKSEFKGTVESSTVSEWLGFFTEIRLDARSRWSPRQFRPDHLLNFASLVSKGIDLSIASGY